MRVVVSSSGKSIDSQVESVFGRCPYYLVVDVEEKEIRNVKAVENKGVGHGHGAGFAAAQQVGDLKADCIITGNIGPNASRALNELGVRVYRATGNIKDAIKELIDGKLDLASAVPGHSGTLGKNAGADHEVTEKSFRKKLAIATENGKVAVHFGRCPQFTIAEIEEGKVVKKELIDNPGHRAGYLPEFLNRMGVNYLITGSIGPMAQDFFSQYRIKVITGVQGRIDKIITDFVEDKIESGDSLAKPGEGKGLGIDRTD